MGSNILVGCAGWSYKDWSGVFYPKSMQSSEYLSYYSKFFDFAEVNSTFYNIPTRPQLIHGRKKHLIILDSLLRFGKSLRIKSLFLT